MEINIEIYSSLSEIAGQEYNQLHVNRAGSLFYDWRFLMAAETSPLLDVIKTRYLVVRAHGQMLALLPTYLQTLKAVDPFGVLAENAGLHDEGGETILSSHIMHCFDTTIPCARHALTLHDALFCRLRELAVELGASYCGLLNVEDPWLVQHAGAFGMNVNYMLDRWYAGLTEYRDFDQFVTCLPYSGRSEMRRQIRKFEASSATLSMLAPPFDDRLEQLAALCQETTARHGTPHYFPAGPLARFVRQCGDLVRLNLIEREGVLIAGMFCFQEPQALHLWSAGMRYDQVSFSPYTLAFANAYRYAFQQGIPRLEAGRLNAKIKTRLGLQPVRLYTVTSARLLHPPRL